MAADRASACVSCHKKNSGSERANQGFTRSDRRYQSRTKIAQIVAYLSLTRILIAHIFAQEIVAMPQPETNRNKIVARLERDGWVGRHGGDHDVYKHPARSGRIIVPRHRALSPSVARAIAKVADWQD